MYNLSGLSAEESARLQRSSTVEPTALLQLQPGTEWLRGSDFMNLMERERERDT